MFGFGGGSGAGVKEEKGLRLEGFNSNLRSRRVLVVGDPSYWIGQLAALESQALYKGRTILVIHETSFGEGSGRAGSSRVPANVMRRRWDVIFRVRESFEVQMLATYVSNAPKPIRILWISLAPVSEIPKALWQKWSSSTNKQADVSLIVGSETGAIGGCEYEAIFFPLNCTLENVEKVLGGRAVRVREYVSDIAANGAALVWSNIDEDIRGSMYWYDPSDTPSSFANDYTKVEAADILEGLGKWIARY